MLRHLNYAKKVVIFVFGITVLLIGILLLVLPGPGILLIAIALLILATEFLWAKKFLEKIKEKSKRIKKKTLGLW